MKKSSLSFFKLPLLSNLKFKSQKSNFVKSMILCAFLVTVIYACHKDDVVSDQAEHHHISSKPTFEDVVNFSKSIVLKEGVSSRTPKNYSLADGRDLLEESLNFTYCRPDTVYSKYDVLVDTIYVPVVAVSATASLSETAIEDAFEEISARAGEYFSGLSGSVKEPLQFGIALSSSISNDTIEVYYFLTTGIDYESSVAVDLYDGTDYWSWDDTGGKCSPYSGGYGWGAASIFQRDLRRTLIPRRVNNKHFYYTNPETSCFSPHSGCGGYGLPSYFPDNMHDLSGSYGLLFAEGYNCLPPSDMNHYYGTMKDSLVLGYAPADKVPTALIVGYDLGPNYIHVLSVIYSRQILFEAEPYFPIPLSVL